MNGRDEPQDAQGVPSYRAPPETAWYHFLHGNVPDHQIDFVYRPEVPQGRLTRQHFSHLARLLNHIEPERRDIPAFAIGNLSRDDTQHEPGHGAVAILFAMRIRGATDHAGRPDPPFSHAIAAVDREFDQDGLCASALALYEHVRSEPAGQGFYPRYVDTATTTPQALRAMLDAYVATFDDLPRPATSTLAWRWSSAGASQSRRIVIVTPDDCTFEQIAQCAARIAAVLYRSDIRWTSITSGREVDIPNGVSIRLVARRDMCHVATDALILPMDRVPAGEDDLAFQLFGARARTEHGIAPGPGPASAPSPVAPSHIACAPVQSTMDGAMQSQAVAARPQGVRRVWIGLGIACILSMAVGAHEAIRRARSSRDASPAMPLPRGLERSAAATGAPLDATAPDVKEPIVIAPRAWPVEASSAVPIAPSSAPASPLPTAARKSPLPAQAPASRPALEKASRASAPGREPPMPPVPATSAPGPEAPPFSTLDNTPVDK